MLYHLLKYLDSITKFPGDGLYKFLTFRSGVAFILALLISLFIGKRIIKMLRKQQIGETIRDLGLQGQSQKAGTPTMGGIIIILATLIPVLLIADLTNIYVLVLILTTIWMGMIGLADDYIKVFKKDKKGLKGKFKLFGQIGLGIIVGAIFFFSDDVVIREAGADVKSMATTIPFLKNNEFDYSLILTWFGEGYESYGWAVFIPVVVFVIAAVSNGANLTDGIDGLATGSSAISVLTLGILTFISGNIIFSNYLDLMFIPNSGEMTVFISAFGGALIGFLWYNSFPAQVFMGDTGSLTIGGVIAVIAIAIRKELMIPVICGVFLVENLSVIIQVSWFKISRRFYGEGRRVFLMTPIHHHFQKKAIAESKISTRFWIFGILLAIFSIISLKLR